MILYDYDVVRTGNPLTEVFYQALTLCHEIGDRAYDHLQREEMRHHAMRLEERPTLLQSVSEGSEDMGLRGRGE